MILCEVVLILCQLTGLFISTYTDWKEGIVSNRVLIVLGSLVAVTDVIYYIFFASPFALAFLLNAAVTVILAFFLYYEGIWGAGDGKIFLLTAVSVPLRRVASGIRVPGFFILALVFSCSFLILAVSSLWRECIRNRGKGHLQLMKMNALLEYCKRAAVVLPVVSTLNTLTLLIDPRADYSLLFSLDFIAMIFMSNHVIQPARWVQIACIVYSAVLLVATGTGIPWMILPLLVIQWLAAQDNIDQIPASELCRGMILDFSTVSLFQDAKDPDLPHRTTADMRSRLTEKETEAVRKWVARHPEIETLCIIRKTPFVFYIALGTLLFWGLEVVTK